MRVPAVRFSYDGQTYEIVERAGAASVVGEIRPGSVPVEVIEKGRKLAQIQGVSEFDPTTHALLKS